MFTKLKDLVSRLRGNQPSKPQTFDLSTSDIAALNRLCSMDEWTVYLSMIDNIVAYRAESLFATSDTNQLHFLRGELSAMRQLPLIVERMAKGHRDASNRIGDPVATRAANRADRRTAALYASPSWTARDS